MQVWDVTMQDLTSGSFTLDSFKAVVFVGGFSYADVLGSAKGKKISNPQSDTCWVQSLCLFCNTSRSLRLSPPLTGWAASVTFNPKAKAEFERFRRRSDTLSLGVCNGCQLLALLGWVGEAEEDGPGATARTNAALVGLNCHNHTAEASNLFSLF